MPRPTRAKLRRVTVASSDEEEETVPSSQATQANASQRSVRANRTRNGAASQSTQRSRLSQQSQFLEQFESSQVSESSSKRGNGRRISDEEVAKLARDVVGFLLDWDQGHKGPVPRALLMKHAVLPENNQHYKRILAEANVQLTRLGADLVLTNMSSSNVVIEYRLPDIKFELLGDDGEDDVSELEDGVRDFLLGLILLHPDEIIKEDELKTLWVASKMEGCRIADEDTVANKFDMFLKQHLLPRAVLEKRCITNAESQVKETLYSWGPRAYAETTKLEALLTVCSVRGVDPTRCANYDLYVQEYHDRSSDLGRQVTRNFAREFIAGVTESASVAQRES